MDRQKEIDIITQTQMQHCTYYLQLVVWALFEQLVLLGCDREGAVC